MAKMVSITNKTKRPLDLATRGTAEGGGLHHLQRRLMPGANDVEEDVWNKLKKEPYVSDLLKTEPPILVVEKSRKTPVAEKLEEAESSGKETPLLEVEEEEVKAGVEKTANKRAKENSTKAEELAASDPVMG